MNPLETRFDCYELNDMTLRILLEFWSENLEIWNEFRPEFYYLLFTVKNYLSIFIRVRFYIYNYNWSDAHLKKNIDEWIIQQLNRHPLPRYK